MVTNNSNLQRIRRGPKHIKLICNNFFLFYYKVEFLIVIIMYSIQIHDRNYTSWKSNCIDLPGNPADHHFFDGDNFDYENGEFVLVSSPLRENQNIPGILILENNRSYGRTNNKKRLLYKCKPFHPAYPHFLVPYEIPMGFRKNFRNKYVTFRFDDWVDKHPTGLLSQTIGDVDDLSAFYEYQLYCYHLHNPITKCIQHCKQKMRDKTRDQWIEHILASPQRFGDIETKRNTRIFAIDPVDCTDRDDAISIEELDDQRHKVTVYIANVWLWLEAFDMWPLLGDRISTVYLPDKKRSMLPSILTEDCCSLDAGKMCFTLSLSFVVANGEAVPQTVQQNLVWIRKQFHYDDPKLYKYKDYQTLEQITRSLDRSVTDSHDVVAYWMNQMNVAVATTLQQCETGIFRVVQSNGPPPTSKPSEQQRVSSSMQQLVRVWEHKMSGSYVVYHPSQDFSHELMSLPAYTHATSPIRRMVDLINHLCLMQSTVVFSSTLEDFLNGFQFNMCQHNATMKAIKKVQNDCHILTLVAHHPELLDTEYKGLVLGALEDNHKYTVYIEELQWMTVGYTTETLELYSEIRCQLYLFVKEEQLRKKIRIQVIV